jgi:hypothetical protein
MHDHHSTLTIRGLFVAASLITIGALLLAACASESEDSPDQSDTESTSAAVYATCPVLARQEIGTPVTYCVGYVTHGTVVTACENCTDSICRYSNSESPLPERQHLRRERELGVFPRLPGWLGLRRWPQLLPMRWGEGIAGARRGRRKLTDRLVRAMGNHASRFRGLCPNDARVRAPLLPDEERD